MDKVKQKCVKENEKSKDDEQQSQNKNKKDKTSNTSPKLHQERSHDNVKRNKDKSRNSYPEPFPCKLCDFRTKTKDILDKHMKVAMGHKRTEI